MDLGGNMEKQGKFETQELRVRKKQQERIKKETIEMKSRLILFSSPNTPFFLLEVYSMCFSW